jgi:hypothetical protein
VGKAGPFQASYIFLGRPRRFLGFAAVALISNPPAEILEEVA